MEPSSPSLIKVFGDFLNLQDVLTVTVMGAKDLVPKDRNGLSDPYVIVSYPGFNYKSKVKPKTLDPIWNETFQVPLIEGSNDGIYFKVMDKDMISDDFEGDYILKFNEITNLDGEIMELKLQNTEKGFLLISCKLKCYPRPNIQKMSLPSTFKDREQFFKSTRNSWLLGIVKYPMSKTEIGIEIDKTLSKKSSPRQLSNKDRWIELKLEDHLIDIATPLENTLENLALIDRFRVELITSGKESSDVREACEKHLESIMTNLKKSSSWKTVNNNSKTFEMLNGFSGSIIFNNKGKSFKISVTGKMYAIYIGHNCILTYSYFSNCSNPYESSLEETVFKSMPPNQSTLFTSLYCDIDDSLWLKHPFGWIYQEKNPCSEQSHLYSPIHIKKSAIDQIIVEQIPNNQFKSLEDLSSQHLNHLTTTLRNVKIINPVKKRERSNPSLTVSSTNISVSRLFYEFEISYQIEDTTLSRIVNLTTTFGRNFWLISYDTSTKSKINKDTYECIISQIRFDESKKE